MSTPRPPHHSGRNESACTACNQYSVHVSNQQSVWHQSSSKTMKSVHRECTTTAQPSICWVLKCATNCKLLLCTANDGAGKRTSQRCYISGQTTHIEPCMSTPRPPHHSGLNHKAVDHISSGVPQSSSKTNEIKCAMGQSVPQQHSHRSVGCLVYNKLQSGAGKGVECNKQPVWQVANHTLQSVHRLSVYNSKPSMGQKHN